MDTVHLYTNVFTRVWGKPPARVFTITKRTTTTDLFYRPLYGVMKIKSMRITNFAMFGNGLFTNNLPTMVRRAFRRPRDLQNGGQNILRRDAPLYNYGTQIVLAFDEGPSNLRL